MKGSSKNIMTHKEEKQKNIPLLDLRRGFEPVEEEIKAEWDRILKGMKLLQGDNLKAFERDFAQYLGVSDTYGTASGTDSLILGLFASKIGIGDEVILQANCFSAAVEAIRLTGARPILVDIENGGFGPDPTQIEERISDKTKGIIVVHMYGHPVNLDPIMDICRKNDLKLIEDCSHAHGAVYKGRKIGSFGQVGCFSCGVVKNLNAYGDAGVVVTNDNTTAHYLNFLRVHGQVKKNDHQFYGFNSRLDELQAAVLRIKLKNLDRKNARRREIVKRYREAFSVLKEIKLPPEDGKNSLSVYHQFVIRTKDRKSLMDHLRSRGIGFGIHYPVPLHLQPAWDKANYGVYHLPRVERVAQEILSLPVFPELEEEEVDYIIETIFNFFRKK